MHVMRDSVSSPPVSLVKGPGRARIVERVPLEYADVCSEEMFAPPFSIGLVRGGVRSRGSLINLLVI